MKKFISWRRVSTKMQGRSGLGLEAQTDIINYFVEAENGILVADYCEVYTGKDLKGCTELRKAIAKSKETGATLIIAKTDRFRNTLEALQILEEVGEDKIIFCDLPHTDKFTLTLFFAIAEREALLISIRTKQALKAKKERGEPTGGACHKAVVDIQKAVEASAKSRRETARQNAHNKAFAEFMEYWQAVNGEPFTAADWQAVADELNRRGKKTSTGMEFTKERARAMHAKTKRLYRKNN